MTMTFQIRANDIAKNFKQVQALKGVSLHLSGGVLHGLIGPSGAGKTTLMRCLMGLMTPTRGTIEYLSGDTPAPFQLIRDQIAYMPQTQSLYADLSIGEHLDFFKAMYQIQDEEFEKRKAHLLEITRLKAFENRLAGQLSGGMYKKLGLMCSLLRNPKMLLLDEPTNGVDPISRREFWEMLYELKKLNVTILVATAYMDEAERCSMVHILDSGKVVASGVPGELLEKFNVPNFDAIFLQGLVHVD